MKMIISRNGFAIAVVKGDKTHIIKYLRDKLGNLGQFATSGLTLAQLADKLAKIDNVKIEIRKG